jgi:hypothetical protein
MSDPTITAILGMHRSGTSCLAGSLQQQGLYLGSVRERSPHNLKGNRENPDIMQLNDAVLNASEGSWDRPPSTLRWTAEHAARRDAIIDVGTQAARTHWGFKDPRTLLTLAFWQDAPVGMTFAGTFRHPQLVARSLEARSGMPVGDGLLLWRRYNELLLTYQNKYRFPLVSFDVPPEEYLEAVKRICEYLALPKPAAGTPEPPFLEDRLRHQDLKSEELPDDAAKLYSSLLDVYHETVGPRR